MIDADVICKDHACIVNHLCTMRGELMFGDSLEASDVKRLISLLLKSNVVTCSFIIYI